MNKAIYIYMLLTALIVGLSSNLWAQAPRGSRTATPSDASNQSTANTIRQQKGVPTTPVNSQTTKTQTGCESGKCGDDSERSNRGRPTDQIRELVAEVATLREQLDEAKGTKSTTQVKTDDEKKEDKEYDRLSCKSKKENGSTSKKTAFEEAKCLAENLSDIEDVIEDSYGDRRKQEKYRKLRDEARKKITRQAALTYRVKDLDDLDEAREDFEELQDAVDGDSKLSNDLNRLGMTLERETSKRQALEQERENFDRYMLPRLQDSYNRLEYAQQSGNLAYQYQAESEFKELSLLANRRLQSLNSLKPNKLFSTTGTGFGADNTQLSYFENYFLQNYGYIENSLSDLGIFRGSLTSSLSSTSGLGLSNELIGSAERNSRNGAGVNFSGRGLQYGGLYNNSLINSSNSIYSNNSLSNQGSVFDIINSRPDILSNNRRN